MSKPSTTIVRDAWQHALAEIEAYQTADPLALTMTEIADLWAVSERTAQRRVRLLMRQQRVASGGCRVVRDSMGRPQRIQTYRIQTYRIHARPRGTRKASG